VEEELQQMIQELGNAINASLSDSDRFAAAMADLEQAGYDVYVVLEASFGFRRKGEQSEVESREIRRSTLRRSPSRTASAGWR
jgi:nicotinamidase-related amidase